jgi:hypothetical protein
MLEAKRWCKMSDRQELSRETIKAVRFAINKYDGANGEKVLNEVENVIRGWKDVYVSE